MFIFTFPIAFVNRSWPIPTQNSGQINNVGRTCYHGFGKQVHCSSWNLASSATINFIASLLPKASLCPKSSANPIMEETVRFDTVAPLLPRRWIKPRFPSHLTPFFYFSIFVFFFFLHKIYNNNEMKGNCNPAYLFCGKKEKRSHRLFIILQFWCFSALFFSIAPLQDNKKITWIIGYFCYDYWKEIGSHKMRQTTTILKYKIMTRSELQKKISRRKL